MAEVLHPGVYVNEVKSGSAPIAGVSTSVTGFVGFARRGPINKPVLVTSWTEFVNNFAYGLDTPFMPDANLAYAVYGYFQNGGTQAYIIRSAGADASKARFNYTDGGQNPTDVLIVEALDEGSFGNDIKVSVAYANGTDNAEGYTFTVKFRGSIVAQYENVSLDANDDNFIEYKVNGVDKFVRVTAIGSALQPSDIGVDKALANGSDGLASVTDSDLINSVDYFDTVNINLLVIPESQSTAVNLKGFEYAEKKLAFFIADGQESADVSSIQEERKQYNSEYGALYFPWIKVNDPIAKAADKTRFVPVGGHVAGVIARTDGDRGVFKAPAGLDAVINGALDVKVVVTDAHQDLLNPKGINVIRAFPGYGIVIWGARTVSANPDVKYVNVRRSLLYIRQSLKEGTAWAVFEPNNETLWKRLIQSANGFLLGEFRRGMFKGEKPEEAFFVQCDAETNPPEEIEAGRVNMNIGVAINRPGEFLVINISQIAGSGE